VGLLLLIVLSFSYVSFDLYVETKKAQQNSEVIAEQWSVEAARVPTLSRRLIFTSFLNAWHHGNSEDVLSLASSFITLSKEKKAAMFLLGDSPLAEKEAVFRQSLSSDYTGFVDFVVGEHHLKSGNHEEALRAYQNSYETIKQWQQCNVRIDDWVYAQVRNRLHELTAGEKQAANAASIEDGD
jgi:hypothetical protein